MRKWSGLLFSLALLLSAMTPAALALDARVPFSQYGYETWQTTEGLPNNNVVALAQTREGYLWIGTLEGLSRFNGAEFTTFRLGKGQTEPAEGIVSLLPKREGSLWIGGPVGLMRWSRQGFEQPVGSLRGSLFAFPVLEDVSGTIWVGGRGLHQLKNTNVVRVPVPSLAESEQVFHLCEGREGVIWLATDQGLMRWQDGKITSVEVVNAWLSGEKISSLCEDRHGLLWIGTHHGLLRFDGSGFTRFTTREGLSNNDVQCIYQDRDGTLWVGTSYGLNRWAGQAFTSDRRILANEFIFCLYEDREGSLWVGTHLGLHRLWDRPFRVVGAEDGVFHEVVQSIVSDRQGTIWMTTWLGGLYRWEGQVGRQIGAEAGVWVQHLNALHAGNDGRIWLGTSEGLAIFDGRQFTRYGQDGTRQPEISAVLETTWGEVLVGTTEGLWRLPPGTFAFPAEPWIPKIHVQVIRESSDGTLWVGLADKGLLRVTPGQTQWFNHTNGLPNNHVYALHESTDGLWIGTGAGLAFLQNERGVRVAQIEGMIEEPVINLLTDAEGGLWICSSKGIYLLARAHIDTFVRGDPTPLQPRKFDKTDGIKTAEWSPSHRGACRAHDGKLWFPSNKGALVIDPGRIRSNPIVPQVTIERVAVDRQRAPVDAPLSLTPQQRDIEIHYAALSYRVPQKIRYRYQLKGYDPGWVEAGARRTAYYTALPPGEYVFQVTACNNDGLWNAEGTTFAFAVMPPFYRTWWFISLALFTAVSGTAAVSRQVFLQRLRRKLDKLRQQNALNKERNRIAQDIHDDLGAGLTEIALLSELGAKQQGRPEKAAEYFQRIAQGARQMVATMDEIVWAINPNNDTLDHLASYVCQFAENLFKLSGIRCRFDVPAALPNCALSAERRHTLFLAIKEALHNIVQHSRATEAQFTLTVAGDCLRIRIADNGRGFDPGASAGGGNGLSNMRRRVEELQGEFTLETRPGQGTALEWSIPVTASASVAPGLPRGTI